MATLPECAHVRKRKAHRKSRLGCANCKLRRVKCDEGFPECRRCLSFGVSCNYDLRIPDLQSRYALSRKLDGKLQSYNTFVSHAEEYKLELTNTNISRLQRFKVRTALSLGPPALCRLYENDIYRSMLSHPFLMHLAHTVTSIHDRYLSPIPGRRTVEELHHWTKGVTLFNEQLSVPLQPADRDAIWAAASMLGVIAFASIEAPTPEGTWPLALAIGVEPEWFKMGQGKATLFRLAQPNRPDSIFYSLMSTIPTIEYSLANVPPRFAKLCGLDRVDADSSPYAIPTAIIFSSLDMEHESAALALFYEFNGCMQTEFGRLVVDKDPRALLVMAYWYSGVCTGQWWLRKRALLEGRATCLYLERCCAQDAIIQDLVKGPREVLFNSEL